jgi:hypothetical protein
MLLNRSADNQPSSHDLLKEILPPRRGAQRSVNKKSIGGSSVYSVSLLSKISSCSMTNGSLLIAMRDLKITERYRIDT